MMVNIFFCFNHWVCVDGVFLFQLMVIFKITWKFLEESLSSTHIQSLCCKGLWMKEFESGASLVEVYSDGHGLNWCKGDMKLTVLVQRINYLQLIKKVMEVKSTRTLSCVSEGPIQDSKKLKGQFPSSWFIIWAMKVREL